MRRCGGGGCIICMCGGGCIICMYVSSSTRALTLYCIIYVNILWQHVNNCVCVSVCVCVCVCVCVICIYEAL